MPLSKSENVQSIASPLSSGELIQEVPFQKLILEVPEKSFIKRHKKEIIVVGAIVLAAAVLGAVAFFAWPAVAATLLGFGAYGLTLGALAGANLIAQVGLVSAVFAVGGFIAGGGLVASGSKLINGITKAWHGLYESLFDKKTSPNPESVSALEPAPAPKPLMSIAETLEMLSKNNALQPLSPVAPAPVSNAFLVQQERAKNIQELSKITQKLTNNKYLSDEESTKLEHRAQELEKTLLSGRAQPKPLMSIAETLDMLNKNGTKPQFSPVTPVPVSAYFLAQQERAKNIQELSEITQKLINDKYLSDEKRTELETRAGQLESIILSGRAQLTQTSNQPNKEQELSLSNNEYKKTYRTIMADAGLDESEQECSALQNVNKV